MPSLIKHIHLDRSNDQVSLLIDGEEFPWYIAEAGISATAGIDEFPRVTLTLVADRFSFRDSKNGTEPTSAAEE